MKITDLEISENNVKSAPDSLKAEGNVTPREIKHIFDKLPELIAAKFNALAEYVEGSIYTKEQADAAIAQRVVEMGGGDMTRAVYDRDGDGIVDNAENALALGGKAASLYALKTDIDGSASDALDLAQTAQTAADNALQQAVDALQQAVDAQNAAVSAQATADNAMPKAGGTFTGNAVAYGENRKTACLRNITVCDSTGANSVSTNRILMYRK